jgi:hypothetical protein
MTQLPRQIVQRSAAAALATALMLALPGAAQATGWRQDDPAARILATNLEHRLAVQGSAVRHLAGAACWPLLSQVPVGPVPRGASWHEGDISSDNPYLTPQERWCLTSITQTAARPTTSMTETSSDAAPPVGAPGSWEEDTRQATRQVSTRSAPRYPGTLPPGAHATLLKNGDWQICF